MPRSVLYVSAAVIVLCLVVTTLKVTTAGPTPPCPQCKARDVSLEVNGKSGCVYVCRQCGTTFEGPPRLDFSWAGALHVMLQEAGYVDFGHGGPHTRGSE